MYEVYFSCLGGYITGYGLGGSVFEPQWVFPHLCRSASTAFCITGTRSFQGVKWLGHAFDHPPPSCAEVENEWSSAYTHPLCLHGVEREDFRMVYYKGVTTGFTHFIGASSEKLSVKPIFR